MRLEQLPNRSSSQKKYILPAPMRLKKASLFKTFSNALQVKMTVVIFKPTVDEKLLSTLIQEY